MILLATRSHRLTDNFQVVPDWSSSLDSRRYGNDTIHANHMGMCQFKDENDDGYDKFKGTLTRFIGEIKSQQQNATRASLEFDAKHKAGQSLPGIWS